MFWIRESLRKFNMANVPNFPEHRLALKIGMPVMLLQNLCLKDGLANSTKFIIKDLQPKLSMGPTPGICI
jgi:hypothetical protein